MSDAEDRVTTYLCIGCPLGCRLEVEEDEHHDIVEVRGFSCKKGDRFARQEHIDPRRMVTTTVAADGGRIARLPVRTSVDVPKHLVAEICESVRDLRVSAPVVLGEVIVADVVGSGADLVASRDLPVA